MKNEDDEEYYHFRMPKWFKKRSDEGVKKEKEFKEKNKPPFWLHMVGFFVYILVLLVINAITRLGFGISIKTGGLLI